MEGRNPLVFQGGRGSAIERRDFALVQWSRRDDRDRSFYAAMVLFRVAPLMGLGDQPWVTKDPSTWTLEDAETVLWNSPWARSTSYRFFGSKGVIWKFTFYVRLQSARPVRLALARAF